MNREEWFSGQHRAVLIIVYVHNPLEHVNIIPFTTIYSG